jgi:hypothetical protein
MQQNNNDYLFKKELKFTSKMHIKNGGKMQVVK